MSTLGELTMVRADHIAALDDLEPDEDGELGDEGVDLMAALEIKTAEWGAKVDAYLSLADSFEADAAKLARRAERLKADAERLRDAVRRAMVATKTDLHEGIHRARLCAGKPRVEVVDLSAVPAEWKRPPPPPLMPPAWPVDKALALKGLKLGEEIPGLTLATGEPYLKVT